MREALQADRAVRVSACAMAASLSLLAYAVVAHSDGLGVAILAALATTVLVCYKPLLEWHVLLGALIALIMFVPIKRYLLPGGLPVDFEPYRAFVALIIVGWFAAVLVDPAVRVRRGAFGVPLGVVLLVTAASIAVNGGRVRGLRAAP